MEKDSFHLSGAEFSIYLDKPHKYDEYAINPFQLERIVKDGGYKVHINSYNEKTFGPPVKKENI